MKNRIIEFYGPAKVRNEGETVADSSLPFELNVHIDTEKGYMAQCLLIMRMTMNDGNPLFLSIPFDFLSIGSIGSAYNLPALRQSQITHILCLTDIARLRFENEFKYKRISSRDSLDSNLMSIVSESIDFINDAVKENGKVLIHCYKGVSRSCAICCAYLIRVFGLSAASSLQICRQARPICQPNTNFYRTLENLENSQKIEDIVCI